MTYANESHEAYEKKDAEFDVLTASLKKEKEEREIADMYMRRLEAAEEIGKQAMLAKEKEASLDSEDAFDLKDKNN